jgi:hypothetical protein
MRHASEAGVTDEIATQIPEVDDVTLRELHLLRHETAKSALESALSRLTSSADDTISPFGSYLP